MKTPKHSEIKYAIMELNTEQFVTVWAEVSTSLESALLFDTEEEARKNIETCDDPTMEEVVVEVELRISRICP